MLETSPLLASLSVSSRVLLFSFLANQVTVEMFRRSPSGMVHRNRWCIDFRRLERRELVSLIKQFFLLEVKSYE
jgi:hypothetical protein